VLPEVSTLLHATEPLITDAAAISGCCDEIYKSEFSLSAEI
jgi:hypothetical protein